MEQMKMIKTLQQSQQEYKSPFCWYDIVADMLVKVIADEERIQQQETTHLNRKNNLNTIIKEKKIRYVPCSQFKPKENYLIDRKDHPSLLRPTRDTEFETMEYPEFVSKPLMNCKLNDISSLTKNYENYESPFLKCPLCGWEDIKYKEIEENSKKDYTSCSGYNKDIFGVYTNCAGCDKVTRDNLGNTDLSIYYSKKNVNYSGDSEILQELPKHTSNGNLITTKSKSISVESVKEKQYLKTYTNAEVQYSIDSKKSSKYDIETPMQINIPVMTDKLQLDTIKASTHLKIILSDQNKSLKSKSLAIESAFQNMKFIESKIIQSAKLETSTKEIQVSEDIHQFKKKEIDTNTINYIDKEVQNTVCITNGIKKSISLQTLNQVDQKENQTDKYRKNSTESKEVLVNIINQISKGIQTTIFVSRGNLTCHISLQNMTETGTTMSIHQIRNVGCVTKETKQFKSNFVQCVSKEKFPSLVQSKSCNSVTYIQNMDLKHCVKKKKSEDSCLIDTCPQNILHLCKEDPSVMSLLQQLLQNILFIHEEKMQCGKLKKQIDYDYKYYPKENCLINATKMVSAIKSHIMMLELKDIKELKESYQKLSTKSFPQRVQKKPSLKKIDTSICNNKLIMTEEIFVPLFRSTITKQDEKQKIMDKLILDRKKKFLMADKNVCTYLNCKDIGINGSFHRDIQIQSDSQLFKDSACLARDIKQRINVGVQKRDPILVRVIKCNENQAIIKSDKETLTVMTDLNYGKKYISKRIETCGRSTCIPSTICRKLSEANLKCALYKERANQVIDNYHKQSFKNNICDINCKNNIFYDWTDVTNDVNSKIPMCVRSQKYMYARNK